MTDSTNDDPLFDTGPAAEFLGSSVPTLARWRQIGDGPDYVKIGHLVKYRKSALKRFLDECTRTAHRRSRQSVVKVA